MKKILCIGARKLKLEKSAKKIHDLVFEAFKTATKSKSIDCAVYMKNAFDYSIGCGKYYAGYFSHELLYMHGKITLCQKSFDSYVRDIASWDTVEKFKVEIANHFN